MQKRKKKKKLHLHETDLSRVVAALPDLLPLVFDTCVAPTRRQLRK